jgi:hypothetical protein
MLHHSVISRVLPEQVMKDPYSDPERMEENSFQGKDFLMILSYFLAL